MSETDPHPPTKAPTPLTPARAPRATRAAWCLIVGLGLLHGWLTLRGSGGWSELRSDWPLAIHDHPLHFHSSVVSPRFLRQSGTNAGYDPGFMAGYPKSLVFPQSSNMFDVVGFITGSRWPAQTYKMTVFLAVASLPWLVALAGALWRLGSESIAWAVALFLLYAWSDGGGAGYPLNYAMYGMVTYLLCVPVGLVVVALTARYLERGGVGPWIAAASASALVLLVHITSVLVFVPAALATYAAAAAQGRRLGRPLPARRHAGVWAIPIVALAVNAFWWWPGVCVWAAGFASDLAVAFTHAEPVWVRLMEIIAKAPSMQSVLIGLLVPGLVVLHRRDRVATASLGAIAAAGFGWGYLAGAVRALDFLQPGRQTFALYAAATLAGGVALAEIRSRLREGRGRLDLWLMLGVLLVGVRFVGPGIEQVIRARLGLGEGGRPYLTSEPTERLRWVVDMIRAHMRPGQRLLYEEGGLPVPNVPDPFQDGRYSGLLPTLTGVEVLGGPYLKASIKTNFTQFGGNKLFGLSDWNPQFFRNYARIYRPSAIVCWSPHAVQFCRTHPELVEVVGTQAVDIPLTNAATQQTITYRSEILFGLVKGFDGATIRGQARVTAEPGRLRVEGARGDELDGRVVLRYHLLPYLRSRPPVPLEPVMMGDDPVPFIGFRPPPGDFLLELDFPP